MRLLYHKACLLISGTILLLLACEKDEIEPTFSDGVLKGKVFYHEEGQYPPYTPSPVNNVTVKATGPYGSKTAVTNADGEYELKNLGNGTYEIEFIKEGWGATKYYSVQIYGNDVVQFNQRMWEYPEFAIPVLKEETIEGQSVFHSNLLPSASEVPTLRVFLSKTKDVSCYRYDYTYSVYSGSTEEYVYFYFYVYSEVPSASTFYIIFYVTSLSDNGEFDPYRNLMVFPSINPEKHSQVIEYKIP